MASLNYKNLEKKTAGITTDYTYVDLHLDITESVAKTDNNRFIRGNDIEVDYDEAAIRNSIVNIFNTKKGERFLIPEFGADLYRYLFSPVTESTGNMIGRTILNALELWEPRVIVEKVNVIGKPFGSITPKDTGRIGTRGLNINSPQTEGEYVITVIVSIPKLKRRVNLSGVLSENGFAETML
jgi:phage baseplate assembly protein W